MLENTEKRHQLAKWLISIITICILIYLGIRHINQLAVAVTWLKELMNPLLIGFVLALFLNVPLGFIERHLFQKKPTPRKKKMRRPLAILLSFALVIGIFIGIAFLVIPELVDAVGIVISSIMNGMDQLAAFESTADYSKLPFGEQLSQIDIDFVEIKTKLEEWIKQLGTTVVDGAASALGGITSTIFDFIIGLVFSIYILANKEKLKRQISRLIRVWLPKKFGEWSIHVASVCGRNFKLFVAGQTTEAIILGTLCAIGLAHILNAEDMVEVAVGIYRQHRL